MVEDWLKLDLIHQFFSVLAEDRTNDKRRLRFWQRYHKHIDDMYFALGQTAYNNRNQDFRKLRERVSGRLLRLHRGGAPTNNAFIMMMGNYVIVEFGLTGNACFIFKKNNLPFVLTGFVAGDSSELKHSSYKDRLLHIDRRHDKWESEFAQVIGKLTSSRQPTDATTSRHDTSRTYSPVSQSPHQISISEKHEGAPSIVRFRQKPSNNSCRIIA